MDRCSFDKLLQLLDRRLTTNEQLSVFDHLEKCDICRDTVYHIVRDRDEELRILIPRRKKHASIRMAAGSEGKPHKKTAA